MSSAYGHGIRPLDAAEMVEFNALWTLGSTPRGRRHYPCRGNSKCVNDVTHFGWYRYVTGRCGRVTTARRYFCDEHAAKFREKHLACVASDVTEKKE